MPLQVKMQTNQVGRQYSTRMAQRGRRYRQALTAVALDTMNEMTREGRAEIARSGNFESDRWQQGFHGSVTVSGDSIGILMVHDVPYWTTHQYGATIKGQPLLWIPLPWASDAKGVRARDFPGQLIRIDRKVGSPLLMEAGTKEFKYSGHESVTIPKRWNLVEEIREIAKTIPQRVRDAVRDL